MEMITIEVTNLEQMVVVGGLGREQGLVEYQGEEVLVAEPGEDAEGYLTTPEGFNETWVPLGAGGKGYSGGGGWGAGCGGYGGTNGQDGGDGRDWSGNGTYGLGGQGSGVNLENINVPGFSLTYVNH